MSIDQAYAEVDRITRREARNFAYGIMVLPRPKRRAIAAIYAFARRVDDIADGALPDDEKHERLEELHADLDQPGSDPVLVALADARSRYPVPAEALHVLIDGGLQDTQQKRYATFEELHGYCRKVAGAVGVACIAVYGSDDTERAETLGVALPARQGLDGAAERRPGFVQRDIVAVVSQVERRRQPGEPAAHHGDLHLRSPAPTMRSFVSRESRSEPSKTSNPRASIRSSVAR